MGSTTTDFLFPRPDAVYGLARLFDLAALLDTYNESPTPAIADALAMYCDWASVGMDLEWALERELVEYLERQGSEAIEAGS